jgi:hypothetical protein
MTNASPFSPKDQAKLDALKAAAVPAFAAYEAERVRLVAAGVKSQERYVLLKDLKTKSDQTHAAWVALSNKLINRELDKHIAGKTTTWNQD